MPIKGLTDTRDTARSTVPIIAWLSKGDKKPERGAGKDLTDRFRITFMPGYEWIKPVWEATYGQTPGKFCPVFIAGATAEQAFPTFMEDQRKSLLVRRCDGENQMKVWDQQLKIYVYPEPDHPIPCIKDAEKPCACSPVGRIKFIFPDLIGREYNGQRVPFGYIAISTTSKNDVRHIWSTLVELEDLLVKTGRVDSLRSIPFELGREMRKILDQDMKETRRSLITLRVDPAQADMLIPRVEIHQGIDEATGEIVQQPTASTIRNDDDDLPYDFDEGDLGGYGDEPEPERGGDGGAVGEWDQNMISDWFKAFYATSFERGAWRVVSMDLYGVQHPKDSGLPLFEAIQKMELAQPSMKR